jgi:hypothetical protein
MTNAITKEIILSKIKKVKESKGEHNFFDEIFAFIKKDCDYHSFMRFLDSHIDSKLNMTSKKRI